MATVEEYHSRVYVKSSKGRFLSKMDEVQRNDSDKASKDE